MLTAGFDSPTEERVVSEEISSRSEFVDRGTAAGRTAYLEYHGVAAGGVAVALMGGFRMVCGAR